MKMAESNLMEDIDCGNFFDNMDDLLEFPNGDLDSDFISAVNRDSETFNGILSDNSEEIFGCDSVFGCNSSADLSAELSVPYEDIVQLEWLSTFVEDSFSGGGMSTMENPNNNLISSSSSLTIRDPFFNSHNNSQFKTSSPVSVLDSSTTSSINSDNSNTNNGNTSIMGYNTTIPVISHEKRARSKRPRPTTFNRRSAIHVIPTPSSSDSSSLPPPVYVPCSSSESTVTTTTTESNTKILVESSSELQQQMKPKKKKIKIIPPSSDEKRYQQEDSNTSGGGPVRKCMHCEITKTPQWRAGPMGPKTLCNACGVRFKSGRLFPEYRPAASPTFVPALHSNSHKKVVEMRTTKVVVECTTTGRMCSSSRMTTAEVEDHQQGEQLIARSDLMPEAAAAYV